MLNYASRSYSEKRNFIRMKVDAPVDITLADGNTVQGTCRDLSGGGMLVELNTVLPVGTKAEVTISSGHGHSPIFHAETLVTRVLAQPEADESPCNLGLQILQVLN